MNKTDFIETSDIIVTIFNEEGDKWTHENALGRIKKNYYKDLCFVAKDGTNIIGAILGYSIPEERNIVAFIDSFVVLKEYRGMHVGEDLWNIFLKSAKQMGCNAVTLISNPEWKSYQFYMKHGLWDTNWRYLYKELKKE